MPSPVEIPRTLLQLAGVTRHPPASANDALLLIIDMQNHYLSTGSVPLHNVEEALENGKQVLEAARRQSIPVVHVVHLGPVDSESFDPKSTIIEHMKPVEGEVVVSKSAINAFVNTNLLEEIQKTGRKHLIVVGFMTHMCVTTAVRSAVEQYNLDCTVIANCTASRDLPVTTGSGVVIDAENVQRGHLAAMADFFACVVDDATQIPWLK